MKQQQQHIAVRWDLWGVSIGQIIESMRIHANGTVGEARLRQDRPPLGTHRGVSEGRLLWLTRGLYHLGTGCLMPEVASVEPTGKYVPLYFRITSHQKNISPRGWHCLYPLLTVIKTKMLMLWGVGESLAKLI